MTSRDEIYEHLAKVYLGKQKKTSQRKKKQFESPLVRRTAALLVIVGCIFGLSAFLMKRNGFAANSVLYSLNERPLRISYDLNEPFPQIYSFAIPVPRINISKYSSVSFAIRAVKGSPGAVKVVIKNKKKEASFYFLRQIHDRWNKVTIPLSEFKEISDWSNVTDVTFVFEAWNLEKPKGTVLIDDLCFSS